jgi:L-ascorbate metabolism protein UlaG (beta-lactamase superfamily)
MRLWALTLAVMTTMGCAATETPNASGRQARIAASAEYSNGKFHNEIPTRLMRKPPGEAFVRFVFSGDHRVPPEALPVVPTDAEALRRPLADGLRVTWFGHSTVLFEVEGRRVLTDPMWSERASPVQLVGPRRFHPPPLPLADLPTPDIVTISHDHYDHLDRATIEALAKRGARFAVPLGIGAVLEEWGVPAAAVSELDWWERLEVVPGELTLTAVPARHFSGRGPFDRDSRLWCAWAIRGKTKRVFYGGDGGLYDVFTRIGARLGPFDLAALEIGAYDPAWGDIHLGPVNAAKANEMLGGGVLLPIHWATFNLGLHAWRDPPEQLLKAAQETGTTVAWPRLGQTFVVGEPLPATPWWREVKR